MPRTDLPTLILTQIPTRTRLADTRALMQRVQAAAEQAWERDLTRQSILPRMDGAEEFGVPYDPIEDDRAGGGAWG